MKTIKRCFVDGAGCAVADSCLTNPAETCTFGYYDKERLDKAREERGKPQK